MPPVSVELKKQVKAANDIVDVVASYIPVQPAGKTFKAVCPFHNDTRPSLQLDRQYQNFRCWSCDARGDVFDFVMRFDKVEFGEALRTLAERAGIKLDPAARSPLDEVRGRLLDAVRWAEGHYRGCLIDAPAAEDARTYLGARRLAGATVRQFGLGYAPVAGDWLVGLAARDGVPPDVLVEVGLIAARHEGNGYYDRFRDRVMFPIRDVRGQTVGFGGRVLPSSPLAARGPKYYNSAETPLFSKSDLLYGLDLARHPGSAAGFLAVVEGYTDVMMAHQCGVANVVATMGTALTLSNVLQLRRYVPQVVLVFDADEAGEAAADKALELFWAQNDFDIKVTTLPDDLDPCDLLVRPDGPDAFRHCLANAQNVLDFKLDALLRRHPQDSVENVRRIVDAILAVMALAPAIPSASAQVKQELTVTRLAHRLGLRQETVWERLGELRRERQKKEASAPQPTSRPAAPADTVPRPPASVPPPLEKQLLELLLAEPALVPVAAAAVRADVLTHESLRLMLSVLYALHAAGAPADLDGLRVKLLEQGRDDLARKALDLQFTGRHMNDRPDWLNRVIAAFARRDAEAEQKVVKAQLAAGDDGGRSTNELLYRLMGKPAPSPN